MKTNPVFHRKIDSLEEERIQLLKKSGWVGPLAFLIPLILTIFASIISIQAAFFVGIFSAVFAMFFYSVLIPFDELKVQVREYLLKEFMKIYHPNISYRYQSNENQVKDFIDSAKLISCNDYEEEDVIRGKANNIDFYLSEIKLSQKNDKSSTTVFQGILFKIQIPGRRFPNAQIQSKPGLLKKMFGNFSENRLFNFWYDTDDYEKFEKELGPFFPFIRHLILNQKDIRIRTKNNSITIMMKSDMKFLDDPKPSLDRSFKDEQYYQKIGQQINSLLFIVEAFAGKLDKQEVIERLELKELEYRKLGLDEGVN